MYKPNSLWTWAFVGVACIQAAIVLAFEAYVYHLTMGFFYKWPILDLLLEIEADIRPADSYSQLSRQA